MRHFRDLLKRFRAEERGVFAVFFGLLAIVLVATAGAVVDFTSLEQARARAQDALDSAALGLQPTIFTTGVTAATIRPEATRILIERIADDRITAQVNTVTINAVDGMLRLEASITVPTAFVQLVGVNQITASVISEATRKRLNVEVAMVLDNSGSMNQQSRMTNLKAAANCAVGILMNSDCNSTAATASIPTMKIGIVPFTSFVNVGPGYRTASWMDQDGSATLAKDNFDALPPTGRFGLYDQLSNVTWQGCVESRKYPYDTMDTEPNPAFPDTMFVPEFAPDNPGNAGTNNNTKGFNNSYLNDSPAACNISVDGTCSYVRRITGCNTGYTSCSGSWTAQSSTSLSITGYSTTTGASVCSCPITGYPVVSTGGSGSNRWKQEIYTCAVTASVTPTGLTDRQLQERSCKYTGSINTSSSRGPNKDCPNNPLTPLTNTKATVKAAISAMSPQGYTNIHQGAIWGFHMLSPTEPLTEAKPYSASTYKVMIIMTDGENTYDGWNTSYMNGGTGYWAYGYPWNNPSPSGSYSWPTTTKRMASSTYPNPNTEARLISALNDRTVETCTNAKAAGITVYTIGLNPPNQATRDMLTACATTAGHAYFPTQSSQLITVFQEIAGQLANLRLAK